MSAVNVATPNNSAAPPNNSASAAPPNNIEWNATTAKQALDGIESQKTNIVAMIVLGALGTCFAYVFILASAPPMLTFSAVALVGVAIAGYFYFQQRIANSWKELHNRGFTTEKQIEIGLHEFARFLDKMVNDIDFKDKFNFTFEMNKLFTGIVFFEKMDPFYASRPHFFMKVQSEKCTEDLKLSLLNIALKNRVCLHFAEYSVQWPSSIWSSSRRKSIRTQWGTDCFSLSQHKLIGELIQKSTLFSAKFLKNCLDAQAVEDLDLQAINSQLKALSFTIYRNLLCGESICPLRPLVVVNKEGGRLIIDLMSHFRLMESKGMIGQLISILDRENVEIRLNGRYWRKAESAHFPPEWEKFISAYTSKCKATIIDNTDTEVDDDNVLN